MLALAAILIFIFGTIIGSFLNVVILRYNTGMGVGGRSGCFSCGHELTALELVPVLSWLALGGRCSKCRSKISIQYPLVELATGILFVLSFCLQLGTQYGRPLLALDFVVMSLLVVIFAYDLRHKIIPDGIVFALAGVSLLGLVLKEGTALFSYPWYLDLLAGPLLFLPFFLLWKISDGKWIGLGDGKLAWGIGWFLGFVGGVSAVVISFWIGAAFALLAMWLGGRSSEGKLTMKSEIPFAPFLILGLLVVFIWHFDVFGLSMLLSL